MWSVALVRPQGKKSVDGGEDEILNIDAPSILTLKLAKSLAPSINGAIYQRAVNTPLVQQKHTTLNTKKREREWGGGCMHECVKEAIRSEGKGRERERWKNGSASEEKNQTRK